MSFIGKNPSDIDSIFELTGIEDVGTWSSGDNATFLGGGSLSGTFAKDATTALRGASYKYTQAASSLDDYIASPLQSIPLRFRGNTATIIFSYSYDGGNSDIEPVIWDVTNGAKLNSSANLLPGRTTPTGIYRANIFIPLTCTQIRFGFHVKILNSGKILNFDDVELSSDVAKYANPSTITEWQSYTPVTQGFGTPTSVDVEYRILGSSIQVRGSFVNGTVTATEARIGLPSGYVIGGLASGIIPEGRMVRANVSNSYFHVLMTKGNSYVNLGSYERTAASDQDAPVTGDFTGTGERLAFTFTAPILGLSASNPMIVTASESFSTDTASLVYASSSSYTLSTLANAPVGTFITYTGAASSFTITQTTTAPTQTTSSMNANGIRLFGKAYNATSTSGNPAYVAIQIGKGMKGYDIEAFTNTGKLDDLDYDYKSAGSSDLGILRTYNELTGVLFISAGTNFNSTTTRYVGLNPLTGGAPTDAYFTVNASKSPALVGVPQVLPRIATISDVKSSATAGGGATGGAFATRTLNTLSDPSNIGITLASNQFSLPSGEYYIEASAPAFTVDAHQIRLRNITDSTTDLVGSSETSPAATPSSTRSVLSGSIVLTSTKTFELQHFFTTTKTTNGQGVAVTSGAGEVYGLVKITKVK